MRIRPAFLAVALALTLGLAAGFLLHANSAVEPARVVVSNHEPEPRHAEVPPLTDAERDQLDERAAELEALEAKRPDDPCENSGSCRRKGLCMFANGECIGVSVDDCQKSTGCKDFGQCAYVSKECVATDETCGAWEGCPEGARCTLQGPHCDLDPEFCRESKQCEEDGACSVVDHACATGGNEDCEQSRVCKTKDACLAYRGRCVSAKNVEAIERLKSGLERKYVPERFRQ